MSLVLSDLLSSSSSSATAKSSGKTRLADSSGSAGSFRDSFAQASRAPSKGSGTQPEPSAKAVEQERSTTAPAEPAKAAVASENSAAAKTKSDSPAAKNTKHDELKVENEAGNEESDIAIPLHPAVTPVMPESTPAIATDAPAQTLGARQPASFTGPLAAAASPWLGAGRAMAGGEADLALELPVQAALVGSAPPALGTQPAAVSVNALAVDTTPLASVLASPTPALMTTSNTLSKSFKLDNWQLTGIDGAMAKLAESAETGSNLTGLNLTGATTGAAAADFTGARLQVPVSISFGQPQWANNVAERSAWLFSQNIDKAELLLDPPELGRMNVQIQVQNNDQASVTFTSANPNVREALDQSSQRLRDLLAEQGLDLVNVDVSDQQASDQQDSDAGEGSAAGSALVGEPESDEGETMTTMHTTVNVGIDHYV